MVDQKASDLFLKVGGPPFLRIRGTLTPCGSAPLSEKEVSLLADTLMGPHRRKLFEAQKELNFAFERPGIGRFRVNVMWQKGTLALVVRNIQSVIPGFEELRLPVAVLQRLAKEDHGILLVTGPTGNGKSTTSAAILNYINNIKPCHILTLEDPIEFIFEGEKSVIDQREVGVDTASFSEGLKNALRQSPDVLFISDIRDEETMETALLAAESGQLVLSCIHTTNAMTTIERVLAFFPLRQQETVRFRLAMALKGIISLRLLASQDGSGRIPACEVLVSTPTIKELLREGSTGQIPQHIADGSMHGMQTMTQALYELVRSKKVSLEEALRVADSPEELELALREIRSGKTVRYTSHAYKVIE
ncbi:MAG: PilT/PilU family type 4a pilus ATPase [Candidatus Omnitrophica bacterium]|nr:PilT/PilU family type 4a pilus ATPase [Candidatus Omnitrophota bacterium]